MCRGAEGAVPSRPADNHVRDGTAGAGRSPVGQPQRPHSHKGYFAIQLRPAAVSLMAGFILPRGIPSEGPCGMQSKGRVAPTLVVEAPLKRLLAFAASAPAGVAWIEHVRIGRFRWRQTRDVDPVALHVEIVLTFEHVVVIQPINRANRV